MTSRRLLTFALLGCFGWVLLTGTAEACGRCRGGRTYHYNGHAGYWGGGGGYLGAGYGGYAAPATYPPGYAPMTAYAPQATFAAPQAPSYAQPQTPVPQTAPAAPAKAAPQR
jgi:hypothetical protein